MKYVYCPYDQYQRIIIKQNHVSIHDTPLYDEDKDYAHLTYVYNNGKFVDILYDPTQFELYKQKGIRQIYSTILFSLSESENKNYFPASTHDLEFDKELKLIWDVLDFFGEIEINQYDRLFCTKTRYGHLVCVDDVSSSLNTLTALMYSKNLNSNNNKLGSNTVMSFFFGNYTPLSISCLTAFSDILNTYLCIAKISDKSDKVYKLIDCVLDNLIENFPEDSEFLLKAKNFSINEKLCK